MSNVHCSPSLPPWHDLIWCVRCVILGCVFGVPSAYAHITRMKDRKRRNLHRLAEATHCSVCCVCTRMYMYVRTYIHIYISVMHSSGTSHLPHSVGGALLLQRLSWHWRPHLHVTRSGSSMPMSIMTEEWTMKSLYTSCTRSTIRKR